MRKLLAFALLGWLALAPAFAQGILTPVQMRDANLATTNVQNFITTSNTFTAPRTLTVPDRSSLNAYYLQVIDTANAVNGANTLTITADGGNLINGAASLVISNPGAYVFLTPSGTGYKATVSFTTTGPSAPGGSNTQVQYNNAGVFGGISGATSNGTTLTLVAPVLGTPASGNLANTTGFPVANLSGVATGCLTWLATATSANLRGCVSDESGTGALFFQGGSIGAATGTSLNLGGSTLYGSLTNQYATAGNPATSGTTDANVAARLGISSVALDTGAFASGVIWLQARLQSNFATNFAISLNPNGGNVAIGKATAGSALDVNGDVAATTFNGAILTNTAWTTFTPSPVCGTGSGTFTVSEAKTKAIGKVVFWSVNILLSAVGTCTTGAWKFTLPSTAQSGAGGGGLEVAVAGIGSNCFVGAASATMQCNNAGGTALATNQRWIVSGTYEGP